MVPPKMSLLVDILGSRLTFVDVRPETDHSKLLEYNIVCFGVGAPNWLIRNLNLRTWTIRSNRWNAG